jgi:hypothetical protein
MPKYGRGLNYEIALAVQRGLITQPFNIADIRRFVQSRNWIVPDTYLNVCLANGASNNHSPSYKKYFEAIGNGTYTLSRC